MKIGVCGAPSSGKTSLCNSLRGSISGSRESVMEYARYYIERCGPIESLYEQYLITNKQFEMEKRLNEKYDTIFVDSPAFMGFIYSSLNADISNKKHRELLRHIFEIAIEDITTFDRIYFVPFAQLIDDKIRVQNEGDCKKINDAIKSFLSVYAENLSVFVPKLDFQHQLEFVVSDFKGVSNG